MDTRPYFGAMIDSYGLHVRGDQNGLLIEDPHTHRVVRISAELTSDQKANVLRTWLAEVKANIARRTSTAMEITVGVGAHSSDVKIRG